MRPRAGRPVRQARLVRRVPFVPGLLPGVSVTWGAPGDRPATAARNERAHGAKRAYGASGADGPYGDVRPGSLAVDGTGGGTASAGASAPPAPGPGGASPRSVPTRPASRRRAPRRGDRTARLGAAGGRSRTPGRPPPVGALCGPSRGRGAAPRGREGMPRRPGKGVIRAIPCNCPRPAGVPRGSARAGAPRAAGGHPCGWGAGPRRSLPRAPCRPVRAVAPAWAIRPKCPRRGGM